MNTQWKTWTKLTNERRRRRRRIGIVVGDHSDCSSVWAHNKLCMYYNVARIRHNSKWCKNMLSIVSGLIFSIFFLPSALVVLCKLIRIDHNLLQKLCTIFSSAYFHVISCVSLFHVSSCQPPYARRTIPITHPHSSPYANELNAE